MTVLVTGATGFVGRHLVEALRTDGVDVRALARPSSDVRSLERAGAEVSVGDVTDLAAVERAAAGCDVVYNLAVPPRDAPTTVHRAVNVAGAEIVVAAAAAAGAVHVVHSSTCAVYGRALGGVPADETHPTNPDSAYAATKLAGEEAVSRRHRAAGGSLVIVRLPSMYGPGDLRGLKVFRDVLRGRVITIGPSAQRWDVCYVGDAVDGLRRCGELRHVDGVVYNLGVDRGRPLRDYFEAIAQAAGVELRHHPLPVWPFRGLAAFDAALLRPAGIETPLLHRLTRLPRPRSFDISKATRDLGYRPQVALEDGVRRTLAWYRANGFLDGAHR